MLLLAISPFSVCQAGALRWEQSRVDLVAEPEQREVAADFGFQNTGAGRVGIVSVDTSCPCTVASPSKNSYGPGEVGHIHAVLTVGSRVGSILKTITVASDDSGSSPMVLTLGVKILQYASVEPRLIYWRMGGDESEQRIACTAQSGHSITLSGVTCSLPDIVATVETVKPGRDYVVRLRSPARTDHATALIELRIDVAGVGPRVVNAYAYFR